MRVLFVCSLGMSSAVAVKALEKEADLKGIKIEVKAVSTQQFEDEVKNGYDVAMVAPQIRHRYDTLSTQAKEAGIPCEMITPQGYSPLGGPMLLKQIQGILKK